MIIRNNINEGFLKNLRDSDDPDASGYSFTLKDNTPIDVGSGYGIDWYDMSGNNPRYSIDVTINNDMDNWYVSKDYYKSIKDANKDAESLIRDLKKCDNVEEVNKIFKKYKLIKY